MKIKSMTAIIAAVIVLLCSCNSAITNSVSNGNDNSNNSHTETSLSLPFSATDSLNPYVAVTKVNQELSMLIYDPLIKLNDAFEPIFYLADEIKTDENRITVTIKDVLFTDGSNLTASDVEYSINQALKTENKYKIQLDNIKSCTVIDKKTIVIDLKQNDPFFINVLDFPVFKNGTAETKDSNDRVIPPIGCGRYTFNKDEGYRLVANKGYYGEQPNMDYISLIDTPDDESLTHMVEVNAVDMVYSELADNNIPKMIGAQKTVPLTNMVYIGLNNSKTLLAQAELRAAISSAISRNKISQSAFFNFATPATGIYPSSWAQAKELQHIDAEQNIEQAVAYLEQLGYNSKDKEGYFLDKSGNRLSFTLVYNAGNSSRKYASELILQQLKKVGIEIIVQEAADFDEYTSRLKSGSYDLYIGEVKYAKSMDLRSAFNPDVIYGLGDTYTSEMISAFYDGTVDMSTVISAFISEMPIIPICCRMGVFVYSANVAENPSVSISDIYSDL